MEWNDEQIETLTRLWMSGQSAKQIAIVLECTRNTVIGKVHRLNLQGRGKPVKTVARKVVVEKPPKPDKRRDRFSFGRAKKRANARRRWVTPADEGPEPVWPPVGIMERTTFQCAWPVSGDNEPFRMCGHQVEKAPYCEHHRARAYYWLA